MLAFLFLLVNRIYYSKADIGALYFTGQVVPNITYTKNMLQLGTGNQYGPITTITTKIKLPNTEGTIKVTLKRCFSIRDGPFVELIEANPAIGPWTPTGGHTIPAHLGYVVDDVKKVGSSLENATYVEIARALDYSYAYYKGINGVIIKLIISELVPAMGGINVPQALIDLGPVVHIDMVVKQKKECKEQLSNAVSITWIEPEQNFTNAPFFYPEGIALTNASVALSNSTPRIQFEHISPSSGVFNCTNTSLTFHIVYRAKEGTMDAVKDQMMTAGYVLNTSFGISPFGLILSYYISPDNMWLEIVDERYDL